MAENKKKPKMKRKDQKNQQDEKKELFDSSDLEQMEFMFFNLDYNNSPKDSDGAAVANDNYVDYDPSDD